MTVFRFVPNFVASKATQRFPAPSRFRLVQARLLVRLVDSRLTGSRVGVEPLGKGPPSTQLLTNFPILSLGER